MGRRIQLGFLVVPNPTRAAGHRFALQRAGLALLDPRAIHRGHDHTKPASGFSHGQTVRHRSHQASFRSVE